MLSALLSFSWLDLAQKFVVVVPEGQVHINVLGLVIPAIPAMLKVCKRKQEE